ncbi:MAG: carbohydrate kinase family protein [Holophagae bacterium]|nr:carbohydrate kinase family protein [Holophagae bacterium]
MMIVVAGHICLDIIPTFKQKVKDVGALFVPGTLAEIGAAALATGGAVSNTGIALHRLGLPVSLMAKIADDDFGQTVLNILQRQDPSLADGMIVGLGDETSYTLVISPPGIDRMFLHCPGANHTFCAADIVDEKLKGVELFHFGYPTLMRTMYQNNGAEMKIIFDRVHQAGAWTSLDMTCVDPASEAGQIDWFQWLENVLPSVDLFLPSIDEILFMVNRAKYDELAEAFPGDIMQGVDRLLVEQTAQTLLDLGVSVVVIKLGDQGLYLRTATSVPGRDPAWDGADIFMPCMEADVVGTTGAGDCTIAGFLAAFVKGETPRDAVRTAVGVGAFSVESATATDSIPSWEMVKNRIADGWEKVGSKFN